MIISTNLFEIEDQVTNLVEAVHKSELFFEFIDAQNKLKLCPKALEKQSAFAEAQEKFELVEAYKDYALDYIEKRRTMRKAKRELDMVEEVIAYRQCESDLQNVLDIATLAIAESIDESIKVEAGNPFFITKNHHCGTGGCSC